MADCVVTCYYSPWHLITFSFSRRVLSVSFFFFCKSFSFKQTRNQQYEVQYRQIADKILNFNFSAQIFPKENFVIKSYERLKRCLRNILYVSTRSCSMLHNRIYLKFKIFYQVKVLITVGKYLCSNKGRQVWSVSDLCRL